MRVTILPGFEQKVCPVVVRGTGLALEVLVFRHPMAGIQLVKGTVELGEQPADAALRELAEESGVRTAEVIRKIGVNDEISARQSWHFVLCSTPPLPENWVYHTADDGGHDFTFFWWPMNRQPDAEWHPVFKRAVAFIVRVLVD